VTPRKQKALGSALAGSLGFRDSLRIDREGKVWRDGEFVGWCVNAEIASSQRFDGRRPYGPVDHSIRLDLMVNGGEPLGTLDEDTFELIERPT
jgi:hypothetical protein